MLISLSGYAGSGKDCVADILVREHGFRRIAFADVLKDVAYKTNPIIDAEEGWGFGVDLVDIRTAVDHTGWDRTKNNFPAAREYLQNLGLACREVLGENVWVDAAFADVDWLFDDIVISDTRFPNELAAVKERRGQTWRIDRPGVGPANDHISEHAWTDHVFDQYVHNAGTLDDLAETVRGIV